MNIDIKQFAELEDVGLHISEPQADLNEGVWISKPNLIKGSYQFTDGEYSFQYPLNGDNYPEIDGPPLILIKDDDKYVVSSLRPGEKAGPADFRNEWSTKEEAIEDIKDFYFGAVERIVSKVIYDNLEGINENDLLKLTERGLWISDPVPAFCGGVYVAKPIGLKGAHFIPEYEPGGIITLTVNQKPQPDSDAPMVSIIKRKNSWLVSGVGPADFENDWPSLDEVCEDILDFYFGDSARMLTYAFRYGCLKGHLKAIKEGESS